jgi:aryl-alcohol dehydrogenase-like predicted oxidoreductase
LIGGSSTPDFGNPGDSRTTGHFPRFKGDNLVKNRQVVQVLSDLAADHGATAAQLAIAWVLSQGADITPLVGARRRDRLHESLAALDLELSDEVIARISALFPPGSAAGERYDPIGMRAVNR